MSINAIIGGQWGDEGKGKIVDLLSKGVKIVARYQGGANAGHTVYYNNNKIVLHQIPTGVLRDKSLCILGKGMVIDPIGIVEEIDCLNENNINFKDRIVIDYYAHLVTPIHKMIDRETELKSGNKIGTTCKGIGPTYSDKFNRIGLRMVDILNNNYLKTKIEERINSALENNEINKNSIDQLEKEMKYFYECCEMIKYFIKDSFPIIYNNINDNILIEGAQGTLLDIDHGTYPFVTSSSCSSGGIATGLGIPGNKVNDIIGIFKAYVTRVGGGPFPTELFDEDGDRLQSIGKEFGATTGRKRRCGWFDAVAGNYSVKINGLTGVALTKLDILDSFKKIKVCTHYEFKGELISNMSSVLNNLEDIVPVYKEFSGWETSLENVESYDDFPKEAKIYIEYLSDILEVPIRIISVGPKRKQIILK